MIFKGLGNVNAIQKVMLMNCVKLYGENIFATNLKNLNYNKKLTRNFHETYLLISSTKLLF